MAWEFTEALHDETQTSTGLATPDGHVQVNNIKRERDIDVAGIAIRILSRELAYSGLVNQHPWLGFYLLGIVGLTSKLRMLTTREKAIIWEIAERRHWHKQVIPHCYLPNFLHPFRYAQSLGSEQELNPWEIPLFAYCAEEEYQHSPFREKILGTTGVPGLITTLKRTLSVKQKENSVWEEIVFTVRSLSFLSEHEWVVKSGALGEEAIAVLVDILRLVFACSPSIS